MKLPGWKFLRAETSSADAIGEQLAEMDRAFAAAEAELSRLAALRPGLLLDVTANADAKLERHDADMAAARRAIDVTGARRAALEDEWRQAEASETKARLDRERRDRYAAASKARTEGARILDAYEREAAALAAKLRRLVEIGQEIDSANRDLPEDYPPIPGAEPFNGRAATPDVRPDAEVWIDANGNHCGHAAPGAAPPFPGARSVMRQGFSVVMGSPGCPHQPLAGRVHLPAVALDAAPYWPPPNDHVRMSEDAKLFLRRNGLSA